MSGRMGLWQTEAGLRLAADGPNLLLQADRRSGLRIDGEVLREPMQALPLGGGLAHLLLGDQIEALILLAFATFSVAVTVLHETPTEHVLEALRDLSAQRALVIRDGERIRVAGRDVVCGDLLVLEQGDRVAADAMLAGVVSVVTLALFVSPVRAFLKFGNLHGHDLAIVGGAGVLLLLGLERLKPHSIPFSHARNVP